MNPVDHTILAFLNSFARHSVGFDALVDLINADALLKGGLIMGAVWWGWFRTGRDQDRHRQAILAALLAGFVAVAVGRLVAAFLPFRPRPLHEPALHFVMPYGANPYELKLWSSFPSQHTLFFSSVGVGMLYVSRRIGVLILAYVAVFVALPRVYLGLHYPSDILAGGLLGAAVAWALNQPALRALYAPKLLEWQGRHPSAFYSLFFIASLQVSSMFASAIDLLKLIVLGPRTGTG